MPNEAAWQLMPACEELCHAKTGSGSSVSDHLIRYDPAAKEMKPSMEPIDWILSGTVAMRLPDDR
jgi:hypothetical protein